MTSFRGVSQVQVIESLNKFFDFLLASNVGPLTGKAVQVWRAPGGLLEQVAQARTGVEIQRILENGGDRKDCTHFAYWMNCYYGDLLPVMDNKYFQAGRLNEVGVMRKLVSDVAAWGGFNLRAGARFHVMCPEDHEISRYKTDILKCTSDEHFASYNHGAFKGPFENYKAVFSVAVDFNQAARTIKRMADEADMEDHIGYIIAGQESLELWITPKFAQKIVGTIAQEIEDKAAVPVGLIRAGLFIPVKPA